MRRSSLSTLRLPSPNSIPRRVPRRRGATLIYATLLMVVIMWFMVLAVDMGRAQVAKLQLQVVADAAARYASTGLLATSTGKSSAAYGYASGVVAQSQVEGRTLTISGSNVETGTWNSTNKTFTATTTDSAINAVRVTLTYSVGGSGSVPTFAQGLGGAANTVRAVAVATATQTTISVSAPSQGNLWLAGMPDNTVATNLQSNSTRYDNSGTVSNTKQRPQSFTLSSLGISPGDTVSFAGLDGATSNGGGSSSTYGPDGNTSRDVALGDSNANSAPTTNYNGMSNLRAPITACIAVFLDDNAPNSTAAPANLDFGSSTQQNYTQINPLLKQTFFVGDGETSTGALQQIKVPTGATRIFFGIMDAWQWNDNTGSFQMQLYVSSKVNTVK